MPERYRRKSTEISAVQWDGEADGDAVERIIAMGVEIDFVDFSRTLRIKAGRNGESGWVDVPEGSWVATDGHGDFWPINAEAFASTYESVCPGGSVDSNHGIELNTPDGQQENPEFCPERPDRGHCECWFDGDPCCDCDAPEMTEAERVEGGSLASRAELEKAIFSADRLATTVRSLVGSSAAMAELAGDLVAYEAAREVLSHYPFATSEVSDG